MTNYKRRIGTVIATGAILANAVVPLAFAGTTIEISGNGAGSDNWTTVTQTNVSTVNQNNSANVTNTVNAEAETGDNDANFNTGGDVTIWTGDAGVAVDVSNTLNSNSAEVNCGACDNGDTEVKISGNGADSKNGVELGQTTSTVVDQDNKATVTNTVNAEAETGENEASNNTGGDVVILTGKAMVDASVSTLANVNSARVSGPSYGFGDTPTASFLISGNGAGSDNYIGAALVKVTTLNQNNSANITNTVKAEAETGENKANLNTGGDVLIDTGNAGVFATVDNAVNFNSADINCGCAWDVMAKIAGNGAGGEEEHHGHHDQKADNLIGLTLTSVQNIGQGNVSTLRNYLNELEADTGDNGAGLNTGEADGDPAILTGDAYVDSGIYNSGNVNSVGDVFPLDWPDFPSDVGFSFSFAAMMAFFGMSV